MKKTKRIVSLLLAMCLLIAAVATLVACNKDGSDAKTYTSLQAFSTSPTTWNPHTYQTTDDNYPLGFTSSGMYEFVFNDDKTGYEIIPVLAASEPVDVTSTLKSEAKWKIPESATKGYAYTIDLNPNACWQDGTPINAQTYVDSMELLLNPNYQNYRASNYYTGSMVIFGAKNYNKADAPIFADLAEFASEDKDAEPFKGDDGFYYITVDGEDYPIYLALDEISSFFEDYSIQGYYDYLGGVYNGCFADEDGKTDIYAPFVKLADKYRAVRINDDTKATVEKLALSFGAPSEYWPYFCHVVSERGAAYSFENVGCYKSGDYQITLVFEKSLTGFYLLYNLAGSWLVNPTAYRTGLSEDPTTKLWNNTYNTTVETAWSNGPYKLTTYQKDKLMVFEKNDKWFGYSDSRFEGMYQCTHIRSTYVSEASTRKEMFLKGELDTYGLQSEDYADYRLSDYAYTSPGTTIFFMVLASDPVALKGAEKEGVDKEIIANPKFRHALSLTFQKEAFAANVSPARSGAYSVIGAYDIWNPSTGEKYRDTAIAKTALVEFYGFVKNSSGKWQLGGTGVEYELDDAVKAITGYSPSVAKDLFLEAYNEQVAAGKIGLDDVIEIEYAVSTDSAFMTKTINELNAQIQVILEGTVLSNRVKVVKSSNLGNNWVKNLRSSASQTSLCGWEGGMLDPFSSMLYYTEPMYEPYAHQWWDATKVMATFTIPYNGSTTLTMSLNDWAHCLTGDVVTVDGVDYNFGFEQVDDEVRLTILAEMEKQILSTDYYIPMLQDGGMFLLTKKVNYALGPDDYNAVLGRGGIAYMTFNYSDAEWAAYVASQGGTLAY